MNIYGHKVNQLARYFNKQLNESLSPYELYSSQWAIIMYIYKNRECTQVELGKYLCVEAPTITRTLSRMENIGWIVRSEGEDKRSKIISLTEKSIDMYPKWEESSKALERKAIEGIDEEDLNTFNKVIDAMMTKLK